MKETVLIFGGVFGALAVVLGAFGAHALKRSFNADQLKSFETGVKYQLYHAFLLIISGIVFPFMEITQTLTAWFLIIGVILFSFSIYGLCWSGSRGRKISILGPITPIGGLFLILGWIFFTISIAKIASYL
ncbi:DUF423 domain-containing protein [Christiangramia salexigens]|uniref:DUF423 domain-containing protein n=1 Tax=Christiangramia salexigens TaxID=1913577 RepID=A0A1L3J3L1_9FLAO|nr:DUF423 domain-containing protein [Christiangramia salexigens]APG59719.1 hypothetical protein LPB144_04510 [Christiangramia salexigens]